MPISNGSYLQNPTITVSGGTPRTLSEISDGNGKKEVFEDNGAAFLDRKVFKFSVTNPKVSSTSPNGYTQVRNDIVLVSPYTPSGGARTTNTIRVNISVDPSLPAADKRILIKDMCSLLLDADVDSFLVNGSLA